MNGATGATRRPSTQGARCPNEHDIDCIAGKEATPTAGAGGLQEDRNAAQKPRADTVRSIAYDANGWSGIDCMVPTDGVASMDSIP